MDGHNLSHNDGKKDATEKDRLKDSLRTKPGAAINDADNDKVSNCLVKEEVKTLNNNPRNNDM